MASSYKYLADHDRVVINNELDTQVTDEKGAGWATSSYSPYYFVQFASGSTEWALATRTFDITYGRSADTLTSSAGNYQAQKNIYNQFAKVLLGHESNGTIKKFNLEPEDASGAKVLHNALFVNFCRSQMADKIKQGSFDLTINPSGSEELHLIDSGSIIRECATGEYALLYASSSNTTDFDIVPGVNDVQGLLFYEAGVAVISPYVFSRYDSINANPSGSDEFIGENTLGILSSSLNLDQIYDSQNIAYYVTTGSIEDGALALSENILTASYQSTTELNSSIYFCRAYNHEFNYSSNPTYLKDSKIVVKGDDPEALPRTYITTVGLYGEDNQLLAVAKLSEPVLKTPENELIARVRIDF